MARKKKQPPVDELAQLEESYQSLTGRKLPRRQRKWKGLGFLLLLLAALILAACYLSQVLV